MGNENLGYDTEKICCSIFFLFGALFQVNVPLRSNCLGVSGISLGCIGRLCTLNVMLPERLRAAQPARPEYEA